MFDVSMDCNIGLQLMDNIPFIVDEILNKVNPNTNVYFKSYFEVLEYDNDECFPLCKSGLLIYLSKEDYLSNNVFRKIETNKYGSGGIYSYKSVYKCGLMHRFHKFLFNECNEYFKLKNDNLLHSFREIEYDVKLDDARSLSRYIGVNFVFIPLSLEDEERLIRNYSTRDIVFNNLNDI